ncbi:hypothetical protein P153DRAFT_359398 [Dothidotthia symphoricarpi CBS 119687]|uniref:Uncharacterized protein n=1 Tax=Dothidotthia symphoricarpi CBS 119687 TaxID=1392245 RepID=A0A6A6A5L1_9PLEO|nr:uncharacterized protein P153DRAFT_359398 [Dothidotthia symphoricarpi CBS 119687]KAF2126394.1 hypothetical protein P153DRAFT_359398 [Dothidotthia symphoricarpi CBS 119687]
MRGVQRVKSDPGHPMAVTTSRYSARVRDFSLIRRPLCSTAERWSCSHETRKPPLCSCKANRSKAEVQQMHARAGRRVPCGSASGCTESEKATLLWKYFERYLRASSLSLDPADPPLATAVHVFPIVSYVNERPPLVHFHEEKALSQHFKRAKTCCSNAVEAIAATTKNLVILGSESCASPTCSSTLFFLRACHDGSVYRESINTIEKPLYPPTLYDDVLVLQTVENVIDAYDPGNSIAALPREGLLPSQPFPWDTSKDVYAYHGYHSLHSVQVIYRMLRELAGDEAINGHALHSLVVLWEDALCTVDTTPRSVNSAMLLNDTAVAEAGQVRQQVCRDWSRVERIARENSACFKDLGAAKARQSNIEEWLHCPIDSPYQDKVNKYLADRRGAV